jgi:hypothetical protein
VLDIIVVQRIFDKGVNNTMLVLKKRRQMTACDVTVFIDSGRQYGTTMLPIPPRIVGSTAKKRNPEGCSSNDHTYLLNHPGFSA